MNLSNKVQRLRTLLYQDPPLIVVIQGTGVEGGYGVGFVAHVQDHISYIVTCSHILHHLQIDQKELKVGKCLFTSKNVQYNGGEDGDDLAIIQVEGLGVDQAFSLKIVDGDVENQGLVATFKKRGKVPRFDPVTFVCTARANLMWASAGSNINCWNIEVEDPEQEGLERGYSGSPILDLYDQQYSVIGVVDSRDADNRSGTAISINNASFLQRFHELCPGVGDLRYSTNPRIGTGLGFHYLSEWFKEESEDNNHQIASLENQIASLENQIASLENQIASLKTQKKDGESKIDRLEEIQELFLQQEGDLEKATIYQEGDACKKAAQAIQGFLSERHWPGELEYITSVLVNLCRRCLVEARNRGAEVETISKTLEQFDADRLNEEHIDMTRI
jgi:hypothetical protein